MHLESVLVQKEYAFAREQAQVITTHLWFPFINLYLSRNSYALRKCFGTRRICVCYRTSASYNGSLKMET